MMAKLKALWETTKTTLHYGPSTEPLWTHVIELLHNFEARIAALETGLKAKISELMSETQETLFGNIDKAMEREFQSLVIGFKNKIDQLESDLSSARTAFEARLAAIEGHPALSIPPLVTAQQPETAPAPAPAASTETVKPSEQVIQPDTPAATSAVDSSGAGNPAASPSANPLPEQAAGLSLDQGEHHGE